MFVHAQALHFSKKLEGYASRTSSNLLFKFELYMRVVNLNIVYEFHKIWTKKDKVKVRK